MDGRMMEQEGRKVGKRKKERERERYNGNISTTKLSTKIRI